MLELWQSNPSLIAEQFDHEIVLIDIEKGLYFSLRGAATEIWNALATPQALQVVMSAFSNDLEEMDKADLTRAIELMQQHGLIVRSPNGPVDPVLTIEAIAFTPPSVEVFSDLAELIAIDPVHEVDAAEGWPLRPPGLPGTR